jgi:hypothetical protein
LESIVKSTGTQPGVAATTSFSNLYSNLYSYSKMLKPMGIQPPDKLNIARPSAFRDPVEYEYEYEDEDKKQKRAIIYSQQ